MALTFFWRCEGATLTAGVDYSAGDTTATAANSATIDAAAARYGTNGVLTAATATSRYGFDPTSIVNKAVGAVGFSFRFPSSLPPAANSYGVRIENAAASDTLGTEISSTYVRLRATKNGVGSAYATATYSPSTATWYGVVFRWDFANDRMACELYDASGNLLASGENTGATVSDYEIDALTTYGLRVGNSTGAGTIVMHVDNVFVADAYDEPIQNNFGISDIDDYVGTASVKYLKLLVAADVASETGIEGVVLNATRDTVIGEFSGQAFEASLESGEAVLLIPATDITPDGSTLTTSDTPIVFAYNATDSIVGPGSATVIEV